MSKNDPRVSIGLPVYNGERFLAEALDSILAQTYADFELIISDNASTDRTEEICRTYALRDDRVRYFRNETNLGLAPNCNRAFQLSTGEYFRWAAHDDLLERTYLSRCVETLDQAPSSVVCCFPFMVLIDEEGQVIRKYDFISSREVRVEMESFRELGFAEVVRLTSGRIVQVIWGLTRTSALRQTRLLGSYAASDLVLAAELSLVGKFLQIPEHLFLQRLHGQQKLRAGRSRKQEALFWDMANTSARVSPVLIKVFLEFIRGINRSELRWSTKIVRYCQLSGFWGQIGRQWLAKVIGRTWSSVTLLGAAISSYTHLPLRLWAVGRLIRRRYGWRVGAAIRDAWKMSEHELLYRTALAFVGRWNSPSQTLVTNWLEAPSEVQRSATAAALADRLSGSRECASAYPLTRSKRRAYARLFCERLRTETSEEVLQTIADSLAVYGDAEDRAMLDEVLAARIDLPCEMTSDLRKRVGGPSDDLVAEVSGRSTP